MAEFLKEQNPGLFVKSVIFIGDLNEENYSSGSI